jgi:hypothetical protein
MDGLCKGFCALKLCVKFSDGGYIGAILKALYG